MNKEFCNLYFWELNKTKRSGVTHMAKKKVLDRSMRKKKHNAERSITRKVKKIKKERPELTEQELKEIQEAETKRYEELKETYKVDYLNPKEMHILDGVLRNRDKKELAQELDLSLSGVYYIIQSPEFQKAYQEEMTQKYADMKRSRKTYYVKIAEKGLVLLLNRLEEAERREARGDLSWEKTRDIIAIIDRVINLMQDEDGTKKTNINVSGEMETTNVNVNGTIAEFDLADQEFRTQFAQILSKTKEEKPLI